MSDGRGGVNYGSEEARGAPPRWTAFLAILVVVLALLILWLFAMNAPDDQTALASTTSFGEPTATPTTYTPSTTTASIGCEQVTQLTVTGFFAATEQGVASEIDGYFATDGFIEFIDLPNRTGEAARDRVSLLAYFSAGISDGWRLVLDHYQYHGGSGDRYAGFGVVAHNQAGLVTGGTGLVDCSSGEITRLVFYPPTVPEPTALSTPELEDVYNSHLAIHGCFLDLDFDSGLVPAVDVWFRQPSDTRWDPVLVLLTRFPDDFESAAKACIVG